MRAWRRPIGKDSSVLSCVALGEVGIAGSREVSRLSRTDKDWSRLLEVCQIFGTLIADEAVCSARQVERVPRESANDVHIGGGQQLALTCLQPAVAGVAWHFKQ